MPSGKARLNGACRGDNPRPDEAAGLHVTPVSQIDEITAAHQTNCRDTHLYVDDAAIEHAHRELRVVHRGLLRLESRQNIEIEIGVRVDQSGKYGKARQVADARRRAGAIISRADRHNPVVRNLDNLRPVEPLAGHR
jgi:hypothetical protein